MSNSKRLTLATMVLALLVGACGFTESRAFGTIAGELRSGQDLSGGLEGVPEPTTAGATATTAAPSAPSEGGEDEGGERLGDGAVTPVVAAVDTGRDITYTATVTVAVTDVADATARATQAIQALGGIIFGQQTTGNPPQSTLVFKVLPEDFQTALQRLGDLGELRDQQISADDVTDRVVDLKSRISTAEASVERLRELLVEAADINNVVALENQLLERETQLETLRGQLRTIQDQVSLATIFLTITEAASQPGIRVDVTAYPGHDEGLACPGTPGLGVDRDTEITVCFEIINTGDSDITDIALRDPILDLEIDDLIAVLGTADDTLEPGESIVLAAEMVAERRLRTQTNVTATALDKDGRPIDRPVANTTSIELQAHDPAGIPTFSDGVEGSYRLLVDFGRVMLLVLGALLPFIWVPVLLWWLWTRRRRPQAVAPPPPPAAEPEKEEVGAPV